MLSGIKDVQMSLDKEYNLLSFGGNLLPVIFL